MEIKNVDSGNDLFRFINAVTIDVAKSIIYHNWLNETLIKQEGQEDWDRWMIEDHPLLREIDSQIFEKLPFINEICGTDFVGVSGTRMWIDLPKSIVPIHLDGVVMEDGSFRGVDQALQLFWKGPRNSGTEFYFKNSKNDLRYKFPFTSNTGYFMLNNPDLWHGMIVPCREHRFTTYTYFH